MWEYNCAPSSDELMHYGILGMRWGVRRSQAQLARANRERKASNKAADYEYKASIAKMKKKGNGRDAEAIAKAKKKRIANREEINQEYDRDVDRIKMTEKGKNYVANALAGAVGGTLVAAAYSKHRYISGKSMVTNLLVGGVGGAALGALKTARDYERDD